MENLFHYSLGSSLSAIDSAMEGEDSLPLGRVYFDTLSFLSLCSEKALTL